MFLLRLIDIFLSLILIIFLSIIYFLLIILIFLDGLPIFYLSERIGKNGLVFVMYKFRSMNELKRGKMSESKRLNNFGIFLRRTSLDELPQLFNVLKGDMSLVGPRALPREIEKKIIKKKKIIRRSVRPGITGLSQINYQGKKRNLNQKINLDITFIKNLTVFNYFKILFKTSFVLIRRYKGNKNEEDL